jgi:nitrate reductase (NAD(P)H)
MAPVPSYTVEEQAPQAVEPVTTLKKNKTAPFQLHSDFPTLPEENGATGVVDLDIGTPDHWIERDERIIRLTGKVRRIF